jgi:hypothetical protein
MKTRFIAAAMVLIALWGVSAPLALSASTHIAGQTSRLRTHSCCPHGRSVIALPFFVSPAPATMPCGGQSPCCAKQAPAKPALLALNQDERPALEISPVWTNDTASNHPTAVVKRSCGLSLSLLLHSTVLRN